jgi:hypothetical protein
MEKMDGGAKRISCHTEMEMSFVCSGKDEETTFWQGVLETIKHCSQQEKKKKKETTKMPVNRKEDSG